MPEVSEAPVVSCIEETRLLQRSPSGSDMEAISFCPPTTPFEPSRRLQVADDSIKPEPRNANVIAGNSSLFQVPRLGVVLVSVVLFLVWLAVDNYSMLNDSIFRLETFGLLMGWGSSVSYHLSRVPQLWLNHKRKSVEGLSLAMFAIIFAANASYASSLLSMIPVTGLEFFYKSASYVYGPIGSIVIDIFVFIQFFTYRRARALSSDLSLP
ncbi:hypothetical protein LPJ59_005747 [Coemansia sp. RSA 2399]|nr:hypothetical protein LPJ59_005747 [Coemansia sp. RSA 2399]